MEKEINTVVDDISSQPGVVGVVACDKHGLCLGATGSVRNDASGYVTSLITFAERISEDTTPPTVTIETDSKHIFVQKKNDVTLGIYKLK
mmetsp:Transcript_17518/g.30643  ORF Transcript_17518/g.30643 Transcript_17518/m.30643 type:complete len:90 (-) Transcript_17518:932-1201(-)